MSVSHVPSVSPSDGRVLSREACRALSDRVLAMASGGGLTFLNINSEWRGNLRWARNVVTMGGDTQETRVSMSRMIRGASSGGMVSTNALDDAHLATAMRRAESQVLLSSQDPDQYPTSFPDMPPDVHPFAEPVIWFDRTYQLDASVRGAIVAPLIDLVAAAGFTSAGYLEVGGAGATVSSSDAVFRYYPQTSAQYSVTVRDPAGGGSGWAGVDFGDWGRIDATALTRTAIDKCRRSQNPVAIEPGRYTAVLEPQAVCDLVASLIDNAMDRSSAERGQGPFSGRNGSSKIGQLVVDTRVTISAGPQDPELGFVPFDWSGEPYLETTWIERGILRELSYSRFYGLRVLHKDWALPNSRAFRMSGGSATVEELIAETGRGILVTRLNNVRITDSDRMLLSGNTRDGLWLIERGKISKAIKNFHFVESPLFVLNNVDRMGIPRRVFRPGAPAVCPPLKVRDFNFTGLMDAV